MIDRPHIRYKKVLFDENWLEEFLLKKMDWTIDIMFSKSEFAYDRKRRALFFHSLYKYAGLSPTQISIRYASYFEYVDELIVKVRNSSWVDKEKIAFLLEPFLPIKQFEPHR